MTAPVSGQLTAESGRCHAALELAVSSPPQLSVQGLASLSLIPDEGCVKRDSNSKGFTSLNACKSIDRILYDHSRHVKESSRMNSFSGKFYRYKSSSHEIELYRIAR